MADVEIAKPRSVLHADVNGDGELTISDAFLWPVDAFFLPGDWLIWTVATYAPPIARFLELGSSAYGGILSGFMSAFVWLASLLAVIIVYGSVRDFDRALTGMIHRGFVETRRKIRVGLALLGYWWRSRRPKSPKQSHVEFSEEVELSAVELQVLRLHGDLKHGYALSESEIAAKLALRRNRAEEALARLRKLGLIETTLGGGENEGAYRLTGAGRGLLVFRQLDRAAPEKCAQGKSSNSTTDTVSTVGPFKKRML